MRKRLHCYEHYTCERLAVYISSSSLFFIFNGRLHSRENSSSVYRRLFKHFLCRLRVYFQRTRNVRFLETSAYLLRNPLNNNPIKNCILSVSVSLFSSPTRRFVQNSTANDDDIQHIIFFPLGSCA